MTHGVMIRRSSTALVAVLGTFAVGSGAASAASPSKASAAVSTALASCTAPAWTLSGGAKVVTTTLADGATGTALDLPPSATAVSPAICLTNDYPSARGQIRSVSGPGGVKVTVTYLATDQQSAGFLTSISSAWSLTAPVNLNPSG